MAKSSLTTSTTSSSTVDSAGYGGTVDPLPVEPAPIVHYNQGIGNGAEGGDPGRSRPHGSSNDELGQVPGSYKGGSPSAQDPLLTGAGSKGNVTSSNGCNVMPDFMTGTDKIVLSKPNSVGGLGGDSFSMGNVPCVMAGDGQGAGYTLGVSADLPGLSDRANGGAMGLGMGGNLPGALAGSHLSGKNGMRG